MPTPKLPRPKRPRCVVCGAEDLDPILWGFGLPGQAPSLMRVLNLCETCRSEAQKALGVGQPDDSRENPSAADPKAERRAARELRLRLRDLVVQVTVFVEALDRLMVQPSTESRGRAIATRRNALKLASDMALRFGLGGKL